MRFALVLGVALIATTPASAQYASKNQLANVTAVNVFVGDDVKDGCLPQPNALKTEAELILRRSGIKIAEDSLTIHTLSISIVGFAINGGCSASVGTQLYKFEHLANGTSGLVEAYSFSGILAGSKSGFQQQLRTDINQRVTSLANEILKARGQ